MTGEQPAAALCGQLRAALSAAFGPETPYGHLARWKVAAAHCDAAIDVWLDTHRAGAPCDVWVIRPDNPRPERCEVTSAAQIERLIESVRDWARTGRVPPSVCPVEEPGADVRPDRLRWLKGGHKGRWPAELRPRAVELRLTW